MRRTQLVPSYQVKFVSGDAGNLNRCTVPANEFWEVLGWVATINTTATVGNRQFRLQSTDSNAVVFESRSNTTNLAASQTAAVRSEAGSGNTVLASAPAGGRIQVIDNAGIDAADTVSIRLMIRSYVVA